MTPEQFWDGDPYLAIAYREKHRLYVEQRNQEMWIQGLYIYDAFSTVLANAFGRHHRHKYVERPFELFPKKEKEKEKEAEETRRKFAAMLDAWKEQFDRQQKKVNA